MKYETFKDDVLGLRDHLAMDRTALANERTFLAYLRTAIMLLVTSVTLVKWFPDRGLIQGTSILLIGAGALAAGAGWRRYIRLARVLKQMTRDE